MADKKANLWVTNHPDGYQLKREGSERALSLHPTQTEAIDRGRARAKQDEVELIIQNQHGKIRSKDSYGRDSNPPKDKEH